MGQLYRTQVLLERKQHEELSAISASEGRSISELIRTAITHYLEDRQSNTQYEQQLRAMERLAQVREKLVTQYGIYEGDLLAEARDEQEVDFGRIGQG